MRLVTLRTKEGTAAARLEGTNAVELPYPDVGVLLAFPDWMRRSYAEGGRVHAAPDLAPVVPSPDKIICLGLNYRSHIEEMGREIPAYPTIFAKYRRSLIGAHDPIVLPPESVAPDWEVELAIVIGRPVRRASEEESEAAIAGFTICNDVTMRDWQARTIQFLQGKTWERTTPLGPALVTLDEIPGGARADLTVQCDVDGETMQKGRTSDLIFAPVEIVRYLSTILTLEPGDVIATGTPSGVGAGRNPPVWLRPGQTVRTSIEGLGELVNVCVAEE